jgi:CRISPR-associated protein Csb2
VSQGAFERVRDALEGFTALRAGAAGELTLRQVEVDPATDPLFAAATTWRSVTPYAVDRHRDLQDAEEAIALDVRAACVSAGLPMPSTVRATSSSSRSGDGLSGTLELTFAVAVAGPVLLGRTRFKGGGVFEGAG